MTKKLRAWHMCVFAAPVRRESTYHQEVGTPQEAAIWLDGAATVQANDENVIWSTQGLEILIETGEWEDWEDEEGNTIDHYRWPEVKLKESQP